MPGGGFVFSHIHDIVLGVPPQNILAMVDTARQYGQYPLRNENGPGDEEGIRPTICVYGVWHGVARYNEGGCTLAWRSVKLQVLSWST